MQLGIQSLAVGPICCVAGHHQAAMNLSQCYQMVGRIEKKRTSSSSSSSKRRSIAMITTNNTPHHQNHHQKPLKNKRLVNRRVRFNLDESKSSNSLLLVKDSTTPISAKTTTNTDLGFQKNKQKCRKSSASIVIVSVFEIQNCFMFSFASVHTYIHTCVCSCCILQNKNYLNINLVFAVIIITRNLSILIHFSIIIIRSLAHNHT